MDGDAGIASPGHPVATVRALRGTQPSEAGRTTLTEPEPADGKHKLNVEADIPKESQKPTQATEAKELPEAELQRAKAALAKQKLAHDELEAQLNDFASLPMGTEEAEALLKNAAQLKDASIELEEILRRSLAAKVEAKDLSVPTQDAPKNQVKDPVAAEEAPATAAEAEKAAILAEVKKNGFMGLMEAPPHLRADKEVVLAAVAQNGDALRWASMELQNDKEVVLTAVAKDGDALQLASEELKKDKEFVLAAVAQNGNALEFASMELKNDKEVVLTAVAENGTAFRLASEQLQEDRQFLVEAVKATKAPWLLNLAAPQLQKDQELQQLCRQVAGTGLVFTFYESCNCSVSMRDSFVATGASVPGGAAYDHVLKELHDVGEGGSATVWFDTVPVFGFSAEGGKWTHPSYDCGRDDVPVPPEERDPKWNSLVESRLEGMQPEVGSKHPCWCCHWLRKVKKKHSEGAVICCAVSNIYRKDWVEEYGAGSSELSDAQAEKFGLPKEEFRNGRPAGWGEGKIQISNGDEFSREAPVHEGTKLPLGQGCRWERQALDGLDFPVFAFFMP